LKHLMIPASWKSAAALRKTVDEKEKENWSVVALGDISGANTLIFSDNGQRYEHDVIQIFWSLRSQVKDIIAEKQKDGWEVATVGACLGSILMIMKRVVDRPEDTAGKT
jgi:sensor domain CHASE-containing protein